MLSFEKQSENSRRDRFIHFVRLSLVMAKYTTKRIAEQAEPDRQAHERGDFALKDFISGFHHSILARMDVLFVEPTQMTFPMKTVVVDVKDATEGIQCVESIQ